MKAGELGIHRELQEAVRIDRGEVTIYQRAPGLPQEVVERVRRGDKAVPLSPVSSRDV